MRKIKYGIAILLNILLASSLFNACINGRGELGDTIFILIILALLVVYNCSLLLTMAFFYKNENQSKVKELSYILFYSWPAILYGIMWIGNIV
ncbi:hypothetical protein [Dysgonomonas sp.]